MAFVPFTKDEQPTMAAFNEKFEQAIGQAIGQALADGVKIEVGSYVGTGTYGSANAITLTLGFEPKFVSLYGPGRVGYWNVVMIKGMSKYSETSGQIDLNNITWTGNGVSFYSDAKDYSPSVSGQTYYYMAIG